MKTPCRSQSLLMPSRPENSRGPLKTLQPVPFIVRLIAVCVVPLILSGQTYGVPAKPDPVTVQQPDGTRITIFLKGDEYFHWNTDIDGYAIVKSPIDGFWMYAREDDDRLVATDHIVGRVDPASVGLSKPNISRLRAAAELRFPRRIPRTPLDFHAPTRGTMYNLVILVDFTDTTLSYARDQYDSLFNTIGYSNDGADGSVKDYYREVSYHSLTIHSTVVEPVTVDHGYFYYGADSGGNKDVHVDEMVEETLEALDDRGFDFSTVDYDSDGWIDNLTIIHAGRGQEYLGNDDNYIWSHYGWLDSPVTYDGVSIERYHTEPAQRGSDSDPSSWGITRIGVICHESGHFLGLPDLYDYDGDSKGAGTFCIMASGSWNNGGAKPAHMSAWCKVELGWVTPTSISSPGVYDLLQVETIESIYKLRASFPSNEYFLVENRQAVGFDSELPGPDMGMLIWHVDENQPNNNDQTHYKVDLEEASGTQHLELDVNAGEDSDYFRSGNVTNFELCTTPNNKSYSYDPLTLELSEVSSSVPIMSFRVSVLDLSDYVWVGFNYSGSENGSYSQPYNTFAEGRDNTPVDGKMAIKSGSSPETGTYSKPMTIYGYCGGTIGD